MGINNFTYSHTGLDLTKGFESFRSDAYQDLKGVWTIGYGHTGPEVHSGLTMTEAAAEQMLSHDVGRSAACINHAVAVALEQDEFDALVDFVFNIGTGAFLQSTMLVDLNKPDFPAAADQFQQWDHASGQVVAGLLRRRNQEAQLFVTAETTMA